MTVAIQPPRRANLYMLPRFSVSHQSSLNFFMADSEAVQVLVSLLADDSSLVRAASVASLKDIADLNPLLVLEYCAAESRGGRRRFGDMAEIFQVMAYGVRALDKRKIDKSFMAKLSKISTSEIIPSKVSVFIQENSELNSNWLQAATSLLVAIGSHLPDLMMEEIYLHLSGPASALPAMVQILAEFASSDPMQFIPRWKGVLSQILPILGNVRDAHRPIFANAFKCWCQAACQWSMDCPTHSSLDSDVMSFLNSAFELLLRVWAASRDLKVRVASVEALGQMVGLITRTQLKAALPRLIPTILDLYKKNQDIAFLATCSIHNLLNASLLSESGPPLLDFEDLTMILSTLLHVICINYNSKEKSDFSLGLKMYNEVQHCFLTVGLVYPDDLFTFLVNKCRLREEPLTFGALCVLKHLLPRLSEVWHVKRPFLVEAVKFLLDEQNLGVKMALSELIVVMASHFYLVGTYGELFVEYLVRNCALTNQNQSNIESNANKRVEMKIGAVTLEELRAICEKGLLLMTITIPEMENILWPFLLKMIIPRSYTGAVAVVCRCISELWRHRSYGNDMLSLCKTRVDIPTAVDLFARLVVLLHNPLARDQLATQILTVLCHLAPLFPKNIILFWQEEIPKMKSYISDTEDLKQDPSYQDTWDDMIINFLADSLDVIRDADWVMSLGNIFTKHYELYTPDDEHAALLHRCLGMLLQKITDRAYVCNKIDWMYMQANIAIPINRLGLAKAMGLVAASHLDTVLEKLKDILDNVGQSIFQRILSFFSDSFRTEESDNIHAALALMYGYAAKYAPSTVIEARINALVGTNMLSRLLNVRHPRARKAVITAINLLGNAVIKAAESGASFPLKRRDILLDYILTLMGRDDSDSSVDYYELLRTQALAISACTTLVSVEPKLTVETRNHVMKATLGFFAIPNDPVEVVDLLINNLITLLCAILLNSGEDGRSRAELLLYILRQIDQFVSSSMEYQRKRGCLAVHEMLLKFQMVCVTGYCALGCHAICVHNKRIDRTLYGNFLKLPSAFVLPSREAMCLGDRVMMYLPRCLDTNPEVRKISAQILDQLFSISLSLPKPAASCTSSEDKELSYRALSSLEDVIAILRNDTSIDPSEVFNRIVSSLCILLTKDELSTTLHGCSVAVCDKVKQSAEGAIQAIIEFVTKRVNELSDVDISRTTQSLISASVHVTDKHLRMETLGAISSIAEKASAKIVFHEVLATAGRDIMTKDISRLRGGWPMQDAFHVFSQHTVLSILFLEHVISVLSQTPILKGDVDRAEDSHVFDNQTEDGILQAAIFALTAFFRGGGKVGKRAVELHYSSVLSELTLQLGGCHTLANSGLHEPLRDLLTAFQAFCECVGDLEMGKILARDGELSENERWISLIGEIAGCISIKRPKEVQNICNSLTNSLDRTHKYQREAAAAALSEFVRYSGGHGSLLEQMVEVLCRHVSDDSSNVRRLCLRGLVQIPSIHILKYTAQVLGVILALLDDCDESVQLTAVSCLLTILESSPDDAVAPIFLNLSVRLRNLQTSMNAKMRASSFAAFGLLSKCGTEALNEAFIEQVHAVVPRLILHLHDEDVGVRQACRNTLRQVCALVEIEGLLALLKTHSFLSDHRSEYEDFLRDIAKQFTQHLPSRLDTYMASTIQAFDASWPVIQANAIYLCSSILSLSDNQHILFLYHTKVFGTMVSKMSRSPDAIVRATCSAALGLLLKSSNSNLWKAARLERVHSLPGNHHPVPESPKNSQGEMPLGGQD